MKGIEGRWLDGMVEANIGFRARVAVEALPVEQVPCTYAVITCMDARMNLECIGITRFTGQGAGQSDVRVIRTGGAMSDERSLKIGIFLAGVREIAVVMHTDCACCLAFSTIDTIVENMESRLSDRQLMNVKEIVGEPFRENLIRTLKLFQDPRHAVRREVEDIKQQPFAPDDLIVHGLVYELATGAIDVVVNGYA